MRPIDHLARVGCALAAIIAAVCARADEVPLEAFGRLPSLEDVAISPDGNNVAFVRTRGDVRNLVVQPVTGHDVLGGVSAGDVKLRRIAWVDDENVLITASTTRAPSRTSAALSKSGGSWVTSISKR